MPKNNDEEIDQGARGQRIIALVALLTTFLGFANWIRAGVAYQYANRLPDAPLTVPWEYLVTIGAGWGIVFFICTFGLIRLRPWARWGTLGAVTLYEAHAWFNRLMFDANVAARQRYPRDLLITGLTLVFTWIALQLTAARLAFERTSEEEDQE